MTDRDKALAPCPFCGGEMMLCLGHTTEGTDFVRHKGRNGPCGMSDFSNFAEDGSVVDLWNTRTAPQSSADLGRVRTALALHRSMAKSGEQPSLGSELAFTEALAILDQQGVRDPIFAEPSAPLAALRARVAGLRKEVPVHLLNRNANITYRDRVSHNTAIDSVLRILDEVIGRAD